MGMNLTSMSKILKCASNDDIITIKAQVLSFVIYSDVDNEVNFIVICAEKV